MSEEETMMYDMLMHLPQRIENLLNAKESGNLDGFEYILNDIKKLMKDQNFDKGLEKDLDGLKTTMDTMTKDIRETLKEALESKNDDEVIQILMTLSNAVKENYTNSQLKYMDDAVESVISYIDALKQKQNIDENQ